MARDETREVHALYKKLDAMAEVLHEKGTIKRRSLRHLASFANINYDTLKSSRTKGSLSVTNEKKLAHALEFDLEQSAWVDTSVTPSRRSSAEGHDYLGRDTVDEFRFYLRSLHRLPAGHFVRLESDRPEPLDLNLAVLEISDAGQQTSSDQALRMLFSLIINAGYHESGYSFGFCRVRMRVLSANGSRVQMKNRLGEEGEIRISDARLSVRGTSHFPEWYLTVSKAILDGEYVSSDAPLCELANYKLGETFEAELSVRLMDGSLCAPDGNELLSTAKKKIIEQLFAEPLKETKDSQGWLTLGRQTLRILRADQL